MKRRLTTASAVGNAGTRKRCGQHPVKKGKVYIDNSLNVWYDERIIWRGDIMAMPIESKKQSASKQAWMKENSKVFGVRVMKNTEADIWEYLQGKEASTIFKLALREYMENHKEK